MAGVRTLVSEKHQYPASKALLVDRGASLLPYPHGPDDQSSYSQGEGLGKFHRGSCSQVQSQHHTLEIAAWMPSEYVREAYHNVQHDHLGKNQRQPELRNVKVFHFVVSYSQLKVVHRKEGLAKLTIPGWKMLRELWNERYPEGHEWHYPKKKEHRFSRDFYRGQEAVIGTQYGLPGVPHQPMTAAEARERLSSILGGFD